MDSVAAMVAAAVLYVTDLVRIRAFYETCFGMSEIESADAEFCVLASDDWELALVAAPAPTAPVIATPPRRREHVPIKLAFDVLDIEGLLSTVIATGGQAEAIGRAWEFRGRRHLDCLDPEGNVVQLRDRLPSPSEPA